METRLSPECWRPALADSPYPYLSANLDMDFHSGKTDHSFAYQCTSNRSYPEKGSLDKLNMNFPGPVVPEARNQQEKKL